MGRLSGPGGVQQVTLYEMPGPAGLIHMVGICMYCQGRTHNSSGASQREFFYEPYPDCADFSGCVCVWRVRFLLTAI